MFTEFCHSSNFLMAHVCLYKGLLIFLLCHISHSQHSCISPESREQGSRLQTGQACGTKEITVTKHAYFGGQMHSGTVQMR